MEPEVAPAPSAAPSMSFSLPEPVSAVAAAEKKRPQEISVERGLSEAIRAQAQSTSASVVANMENIEKTTVMNKIASLRNESDPSQQRVLCFTFLKCYIRNP